jgi:hypothetical protein
MMGVLFNDAGIDANNGCFVRRGSLRLDYFFVLCPNAVNNMGKGFQGVQQVL